VQTSRYFDRAGLCLAAAAAASLRDTDVATLVRDALPADPAAVLVVGVGAGTLGPVDLSVALTEWTLGDRNMARVHAESASALAHELGWKPWANAAAQVLRVITAPGSDDALPLGL
jgi:hypothetical protein